MKLLGVICSKFVKSEWKKTKIKLSSCGGSAIIGLGNLNWDQLAGTTGKGKIYWEKMIMGWFGGDDDHNKCGGGGDGDYDV